MDKTGREQPGKICTALTTRKAHNQNHLKGKLARVGCIGVMLGGLLAGCSEGVHPTQVPTFGAETLVSTPIDPALVITAAATEYLPEKEAPAEEVQFHAGPESMVEGQYNQLHWDKLQSELDQLLPVLEQYMKDQGITADKVLSLSPDAGLFKADSTPYALYGVTVKSDTILGYSQLTQPDGTEMYMMHIPVRRADSQDIVILNVALDEAPDYWKQQILNGVLTQAQYDSSRDPKTIFPLYAGKDAPETIDILMFVNVPTTGWDKWGKDFASTQYIFENEIPDNLPLPNLPKAGTILPNYFGAPSVTPELAKELNITLEHQVIPVLKIGTP